MSIPVNRINQHSDIVKILNSMFPKGTMVELRIALLRPKYKGHMLYGYYTDFNKLANDALDNESKAKAVYFTLNEINPQCESRVEKLNCIYEAEEGNSTKDNDIVRRHFIFFDADPIRPINTNSSDEQHNKAIKIIYAIRDWLKEFGWKTPIIADSGNGGHALYFVDLPNTPNITKLIQNILEVINLQFGDNEINIDTKVANAARITKLYGTKTAKGADNPKYPRRISKVLECPEKLEPTDISALTKVADLAIVTLEPSKTNGPEIDAEKFIQQYNLGSYKVKDWKGNKMYVLEKCPFNEAHKNTSKIIKFPNGAIDFSCFHNSCKEHNWKALRRQLNILSLHDSVLIKNNVTGNKINDEIIIERKPALPNKDYMFREMPIQKWAINQAVLSQCKMLIAGEQKSGKSTVGYILAASLASGIDFLNDERYTVEGSGPVMIIDGENNELYIREQLIRAYLALGLIKPFQLIDNSHIKPEFKESINFPEIYVYGQEYCINFLDKDGMAFIESEIERIKPKLVIYDSFYNFGNIDVKNEIEVLPILNNASRLIAKYKTTIAFVVHFNKSENDSPEKRISGTKAFIGWYESGFFISKRKSELDTIDLEILYKFRAAGDHADNVRINLGEKDCKVFVKPVNSEDIIQVSEEEKQKITIEDYLRGKEPIIKGELVESLLGKVKKQVGHKIKPIGRDAIIELLDSMDLEGRINIYTENNKNKKFVKLSDNTIASLNFLKFQKINDEKL